MKRPDLLVLIAVWEFLTALGALAGVTAIAVFAIPAVWDYPPAMFGLSMAVLVLLTYIGLSVAAGVGLIIEREWGRILAIIHSALIVIWIPIGTVIGVLSLIYLTKPEVRQYFEGK